MTTYEIIRIGDGLDAALIKPFLNTWYLKNSWGTDSYGRFKTKKEAREFLRELVIIIDCEHKESYPDVDFRTPILGDCCAAFDGVLLYIRLNDPRRPNG